MIRLLRHFIAWPAPDPPTWKTALPITSSSGRTRSRSAAAPPTMNTSSAAAPPTPRRRRRVDHGDAARLQRRCGLLGQPRLRRRRVEQQRARHEALQRPSQRRRARTTSPFGTIVMTMSLARPVPRARRRPGAFQAAGQGGGDTGAASNSCSAWPACARCEAIAAHDPRPMKPTRGRETGRFSRGSFGLPAGIRPGGGPGRIEGLRDRRRRSQAASYAPRCSGRNGRTRSHDTPDPPIRRGRPCHGIASLPPPRLALLLGLAPLAASAQTPSPCRAGSARTTCSPRTCSAPGRPRSRRRPTAGSSSDAGQASVGGARHLRLGSRRPGRRLLRHRQLHPRATAA